MDLQKSKILLEKISALHKSISSDARNVSIIETDLMKSYVLQLYETLLDLPSSAQPFEPLQMEVIKSTPKVTLHKAGPEPPAPKPGPVAPVFVAPPQPPKPEPKPEPELELVIVTNTAPSSPPAARPQPAFASQPDTELEELFTFGSVKDLSEKLSELPIGDIKKAMGLNERIFTMNELFAGDQASFDATLSTLNQFRSFDEAKDYLLRNVAGKFGWTSKDKKNKAKNFIKLVKRRFN